MRYWHAAAVVLAAAGLCLEARAEEPVEFADEAYYVAHRDVREEGNSLVELVREGEKIDGWKKLVAFHRFPDLEASPKDAVHGLAAQLTQRDPSARFAIVENAETGEAIIDFITAEAGSDTIEFNVFKYARHTSDGGIVALQFAERLKLADVDEAALKSLRESAVDEAASFDLGAADAYFGEAEESGEEPETDAK